MPDPARILESSRTERFFSSAQATTGSVQTGDPDRPVCCGRTALTLQCGHTAARTCVLQVPIKSAVPGPHEVPDRPVRNRHAWVTTPDPAGVPVLQVLSAGDDIEGIDYVTISATGPAECPPGSAHLVSVTGGPAASTRQIPFAAWQLFTPAGLAPNTFRELSASLLSNLHPLKLPELPARKYIVRVPACLVGPPGVALQAFIEAYPDVRWQGDYTIRIRPGEGGLRHDMEVEGGLSVTWNGVQTGTSAWNVLKPLLKWHGLADELSRMASAIQDLCTDEANQGYDSSRLQVGGPFQWQPAPALRVGLVSRLFEQPDNGLIGHQATLSVACDPGASGECNLLPLLAASSAHQALLLPLRLEVPGLRLDDLCVRYGLYLVADGQAQFRIELSGRRPVEPWKTSAMISRAVTFQVEGRADCEYETVFVEASSLEDPATAPSLFFEGAVPPLFGGHDDVRDGRFHASAHFTGLTIQRVRTRKAGVEVCHSPDRIPSPARLAAPRAWPAGAKPGAPPEIEWC